MLRNGLIRKINFLYAYVADDSPLFTQIIYLFIFKHNLLKFFLNVSLDAKRKLIVRRATAKRRKFHKCKYATPSVEKFYKQNQTKKNSLNFS